MRNEVNADDFNKQILNLLENPKLSISKNFLRVQIDQPRWFWPAYKYGDFARLILKS